MKQPINILHLIQGLEVGGLELMAISLLERLDKTRYRPAVCCFDSLGSLTESTSNKAIKVFFLKRKQGIDYFYPFKLAKLFKRQRIQILHLHNSTAFFYGVLAGKIAKIPVIIYTEHDRDFPSNQRVRIVNKLLSYLTDRIVTVAEHLKNNLIRYEKFNGRKIQVIYNGIDGRKFEAAYNKALIKKYLGLENDQAVIGIIARLDPIKNHKCLIKAMRTVVDMLPKAILLIVGDGDLRKQLESFVKKIKLENNVKFLGTRSDIPQLLSIFDLFVLCSFSEGLSLTLLEAMAAAKPIIATSIDGNIELIEHGINGLSVPPNDSESLANAILEILTNNILAERMGESSKKKFEEKFTITKMVTQYEDLYTSCFH